MQEDIKFYTLDSSFILAFLLPDERSEKVLKTFKEYENRKIRFISSSILPLEVVNGLKYAIGKRISREDAVKLLYDFLNITIDLIDHNLEEVLNFSLKNSISVYDASYLYLAKSQKAPFLTLDKALQKLV